MISGVRPEEIDPHLRKLLGAIARKGLDPFVVATLLALRPKRQAECRILSEMLRSLPQLGLKRFGIHAEGVVKKSHLLRLPRADRLAGLGQLQRPRLSYPARQRIRPVFRSVEIAHAPVVGIEDNPRPRIDAVRGERQYCAPRSGIAAQSSDDEMGHGVENFESEIVD